MSLACGGQGVMGTWWQGVKIGALQFILEKKKEPYAGRKTLSHWYMTLVNDRISQQITAGGEELRRIERERDRVRQECNKFKTTMIQLAVETVKSKPELNQYLDSKAFKDDCKKIESLMVEERDMESRLEDLEFDIENLREIHSTSERLLTAPVGVSDVKINTQNALLMEELGLKVEGIDEEEGEDARDRLMDAEQSLKTNLVAMDRQRQMAKARIEQKNKRKSKTVSIQEEISTLIYTAMLEKNVDWGRSDAGESSAAAAARGADAIVVHN